MKTSTDVVVVGGGIAGTSIAYFLARAGVQVTLLESRAIAAGASGRNGGGFRQSARALPEIPLAVAAVEMAPALWEELGENPEYVRRGNLRLAESEGDLQAMAEYLPKQQAAGLKDVQMVSREEALEIVPILARERVHGGTFCPTDGHVNPALACLALARAARRLGAAILTGTAATGIAVAGGRVAGVQTTAGPMATRWVVNAAGAGAFQVAAMAGLRMPGQVSRHQIMLTERVPRLFEVMFGVASASIYFRQTMAGQVLFGGSAPGPESRRTEEGAVEGAVMGPVGEHLFRLIPALRGARLQRAWVGLDATMPDHLPILGPAPEIEGFLYATGYSGHGVPLGPVTGLLLTRLITEERIPEEIAGLLPNRFERARA